VHKKKIDLNTDATINLIPITITFIQTGSVSLCVNEVTGQWRLHWKSVCFFVLGKKKDFYYQEVVLVTIAPDVGRS